VLIKEVGGGGSRSSNSVLLHEKRRWGERNKMVRLERERRAFSQTPMGRPNGIVVTTRERKERPGLGLLRSQAKRWGGKGKMSSNASAASTAKMMALGRS